MSRCFCDLSPEEIFVLEIVISAILIEGRSAEELNVLGNFLTAVSAILLAQAAVMQCPQDSESPDDKHSAGGLVEAVAALEIRLAEIESKLK